MNRQFLLIFDNIDQILNIVCEHKIVHIFVDESVDKRLLCRFTEKLETRVKLIKTVLAPCYATQTLADSIAYRGEDFAIAFGKLHLQSLVKYYSYTNDIDYGIIPVKEIAEYSFCKYAFLKDEKFCFYLCKKPMFAFVIKECFTDDDIFRLEKILSYKNIVLYEKEFEKLVLKQSVFDLTNIVKSINICDGTYKSVIKLYGAISLMLENSKTSEFLGCEYTVLSLLCTNKKDVTQNLICATNLLTRFYECLNKFGLIKILPNYNKHIYMLKKEYNLGISQVKDTILSLFTNQEMNRLEYTLKAYEPHLKMFFNNQKSSFMFSKLEFTSKELELALALSPSLCARKNVLRFARDFGYFENLLK